ncbi:MAG: hypothetical protein ACTSUV_00195 [Candidatus Ranarchaeia archaeon]
MSVEKGKKNLTESNADIEKQRLLVVFRACQFLFLAIFAFGVAWSFSDLATYFAFPVSGWALGCSVFGVQGGLASEFMIRRLEQSTKKNK